MKKVLVVLGVIFLALLVVGAVGIGFLVYEGTKLGASAQAYVEQAAPKILKDWSAVELQKMASEEFMDKVSPTECVVLADGFNRTLGPLKDFPKPTGGVRTDFNTSKGTTVTGIYKSEATFEKGKALITMTVIDHGQGWQIFGLQVNPPTEP